MLQTRVYHLINTICYYQRNWTKVCNFGYPTGQKSKEKRKKPHQISLILGTKGDTVIYLLLLKILYFNYGNKTNIWEQLC